MELRALHRCIKDRARRATSTAVFVFPDGEVMQVPLASSDKVGTVARLAGVYNETVPKEQLAEDIREARNAARRENP